MLPITMSATISNFLRNNKLKRRKQHRKYKKEDMEHFFYLVNEKGEEALDDFFERRKPDSRRPVGRPPKLTDAHRDYIVKLVDENDTGLILDQMMESLTTEFMGLQIFKSAIHEFARTKCRISLGTRAVVKTPKTTSKMTTILRAISPYDVVNMKGVRTPKVVQSKKRKLEDSKEDKGDTNNVKRTIGAVTGHYFGCYG
ncbi:hypothetical protein G6F37_001571 [Rhizopus arrhizus]|nr:hypothetical protein G6F38_000205 [Rhizopus arrhizus]KAG1163062.1 hypothetical protein G6F37_001571 [Rhizopus arrhizus]